MKQLSQVTVTVECETDGGKMQFTVTGSGKGQSVLNLGSYVGQRIDEHVAVFSGLAEKQAEIDALQAKLSRIEASRAEAEQRKKDAAKLAELERLEKMRGKGDK